MIQCQPACQSGEPDQRHEIGYLRVTQPQLRQAREPDEWGEIGHPGASQR